MGRPEQGQRSENKQATTGTSAPAGDHCRKGRCEAAATPRSAAPASDHAAAPTHGCKMRIARPTASPRCAKTAPPQIRSGGARHEVWATDGTDSGP